MTHIRKTYGAFVYILLFQMYKQNFINNINVAVAVVEAMDKLDRVAPSLLLAWQSFFSASRQRRPLNESAGNINYISKTTTTIIIITSENNTGGSFACGSRREHGGCSWFCWASKQVACIVCKRWRCI